MTAADPMPVTPVGLDGELFIVRDFLGNEWRLTAHALFDRSHLVTLFGGGEWLRRNFPAEQIIVAQRSGGGRPVWVGIDIEAVARHLADECLYAEEVRRAARARPWWVRLFGSVRMPAWVSL